ncbi:uncharacterized protein LOC144446744 [Glandiceps talaboti]
MKIRGREKPGVARNVGDFANIFKAFIGANFLSVPFDFMQSGMVLGIIGLIIIASMTDHCCHLIIKCKNEAISRLHSIHYTPSKVDLEAEDSNDGELAKSGEELLEHFEASLTYGDLGKLCMGEIGIVLVNIGLCITQLGFCTAYLIFLGTTIGSFFPLQDVVNNVTEDATHMKTISPSLSVSFNLQAVVETDLHIRHGNKSEAADFDITQILNNESYIETKKTNTSPTTQKIVHRLNMYLASNLTTPSQDMDIASTESTANSTECESPLQESTAPSFYFLVLIPFPIFIIFSFVRNMRTLGPMSAIANLALCLGFLALLLYLIIDLEIHEDVVLFRWATFPVFWGHMTAAYEGIGVVIPVESSMKGNRTNFPAFLHGAVLLLTVILGLFGVIGYFHYGTDVNQIITENFPPQSEVVYIVKATVCVGILLTYPLQMFPVIEIFEAILFAPGRIFGPKKDKVKGDEDEASPLIKSEPKGQRSSDDHFHSLHTVAVPIPNSVSAWKRNILRIFLVITTLVFAILFSDSFAYITAVVGAVGSSLLAFILPCIFHLKLKWNELSKALIVKDISIIIVGTTGGIVSLVVVIQQMVLMRQGQL